MVCVDMERLLVTRMVPELPRKVTSRSKFVVSSMRGLLWDYALYRFKERGYIPVRIYLHHSLLSILIFVLLFVQDSHFTRTISHVVGADYKKITMQKQIVRFKSPNFPPLRTELWYVVKWCSSGFSYRARLSNLTLIRSPWNHNVCAEFSYLVELYDLERGGWRVIAQ